MPHSFPTRRPSDLLDPQPLVVEIGGEMRRDEGDVEAADEEARVEQPVAAMRRSLAQRVARALLDLQAQARAAVGAPRNRSEEHTSELQSLMRISYAVFCLKKTKIHRQSLIS